MFFFCSNENQEKIDRKKINLQLKLSELESSKRKYIIWLSAITMATEIDGKKCAIHVNWNKDLSHTHTETHKTQVRIKLQYLLQQYILCYFFLCIIIRDLRWNASIEFNFVNNNNRDLFFKRSYWKEQKKIIL